MHLILRTMKSRNYLALLILIGFVLSVVAGCKAPDEMTSKSKDATAGAAKKAGDDE